MSGGRQVTDDAMKKIDLMDEMDGTNYDPKPEEDNDDDDTGSDAGDDSSSDDSKEAVSAKEPAAKSEEAPAAKSNEPAQEELRRQGPNFADKHGNLVDPNTRQIIAKAGVERKLWEKWQRTNTVLQDTSAKLADYQKREQEATSFHSLLKESSLNTEEFGNAINVAIKFKSDPVAAAKIVLEQVLALGHNVTDILGQDAGNAIEMSAVQRMLDKRLAPIIEPLNQKREQDERTKEAQAAFDRFLVEHEYADVHLEAIDDLVGKNPDLSPQKAYRALLLFANKHKLDFSQPLGPQLNSASAKPTNRQEQPSNRKPFPNGSVVEQQSLDTEEFSTTSSWDDIVKKAMRASR